jgi:hypothetical protein
MTQLETLLALSTGLLAGWLVGCAATAITYRAEVERAQEQAAQAQWQQAMGEHR